jgi:hypothetical protein
VSASPAALQRSQNTMNAIKKVRHYLLKHPDSSSSQVLKRLVVTLGEEGEFPLNELYGMDLEAFDLAMDLMRDWRLDRHYAARIKLFDVALEGVPDVAGAGERAKA